MSPSRVTSTDERASPRVRFLASWVLPISSPPIPDGWVDVQDGLIVGCGGTRDAAAGASGGSDSRVSASDERGKPDEVRDLGQVAVMPAHVNAHTHLELSALRGHVAPAAVMADWVKSLMGARSVLSAEAVALGVGTAIAELGSWGVAGVGEVTNSLASIDALRASPLSWRAFHELLGFRVADGTTEVRRATAGWPVLSGEEVSLHPVQSIELAAHAPYSSSPALIGAIAAWLGEDPARRTTIHLGESPEETIFLRTGRGPWRELLESLGVWAPDWSVPGTDPVSYVDGLGLLTERTLVVHGVQLERSALARVRAAGATLVLCPRSNRWTGAGSPPIDTLFELGVSIALGSDSLASVADLGVFGEMAEARRLAPEVPASWLLRAATRGGARALGFSQLGTIEVGRAAALIAVGIPTRLSSVEEYLVSGVDRAAIRWVA